LPSYFLALLARLYAALPRPFAAHFCSCPAPLAFVLYSPSNFLVPLTLPLLALLTLPSSLSPLPCRLSPAPLALWQPTLYFLLFVTLPSLLIFPCFLLPLSTHMHTNISLCLIDSVRRDWRSLSHVSICK
jgi:hypothetical protein